MMKLNERLPFHIMINFFLSSLIVLFIRYAGPYKEGALDSLLDYIHSVLYAPGFFIIFYFQIYFQGKSAWFAMHDIDTWKHLFVSFIFFFLLIALIQVIVLKWKKRRRAKT